MTNTQTITLIAVTAFILNLPFGYLRNFTKKFSWQWFACIHIPIPFLAFFRIITGTPWQYIGLFLIMSVLGQIIGARLIKLKN